jgi:hypothetical protein
MQVDSFATHVPRMLVHLLAKFGDYPFTRFGTMGTKSPGLIREEQGAYHESAQLAQGSGPGGL